jgi:uncharacterized protein DUF2188
MAGNIHVVPEGEQWAIKEEGSDEAFQVHETQEAALTDARALAASRGVELVLHGEDGQIREKDSHGNDPGNIPG